MLRITLSRKPTCKESLRVLCRKSHCPASAPGQSLAWGEFSNLEEFRNFGRRIDS